MRELISTKGGRKKGKKAQTENESSNILLKPSQARKKKNRHHLNQHLEKSPIMLDHILEHSSALILHKRAVVKDRPSFKTFIIIAESGGRWEWELLSEVSLYVIMARALGFHYSS